MEYYGIRRKSDGALAYIDALSNGDSEFSVSVSYEITFYKADAIFMTDKESVKNAMIENTPWYNATKYSPEWSYDFEKALDDNDIEIVKITLSVEAV